MSASGCRRSPLNLPKRPASGVLRAQDAGRRFPSGGVDLPLEPSGTAFQRRVWEALGTIPVGATASYADIAHRIGAPAATRAVARACASNPLAVAIPCHRMVRRGGGMGGYRWGLERKRTLLGREARA